MTQPSDTSEPPLFAHAPLLRGAVPWLPLARLPTPVQQVEIDGRSLLVKRDDLCADGYAGNKVRKLEFLLGAARAAGARRLITAGATGSHHAFATAYHGARHGFAATLVLFPQRITPHVREMLLLDHAVGAELRWVGRMEAVPFGIWRARTARRADRPMIVVPGGSDAAGTLGYVSAAFELAAQIEAGDAPRPSRVHVAAGTLGTAAGLAIGFAWANLELPVVATRITSKLVASERALQTLIRRCTALLRDAGADPPEPAAAQRLVELRHDQIGTGYGHATAEGEHAAQRFAEAGLQLDATYTAKAAAGLLADAAPGLPMLWHTLSSTLPHELLRGVDAADLPRPFVDYLARGGRAP